MPRLHLIFLKQNKIKDALDNFKKSIKIDSNNSETHNNLGIAYKKIKKYEESIDCFKKSINLNSNNPEAYINLGTAFKNIREFDKAIMNFNKAIELNPSHAHAHDEIGDYYLDIHGDLDQAIDWYEKALKLDPDLVPAMALRIYTILMKGQLKRAQVLIDEGLTSCKPITELGVHSSNTS